MQAETVMQTKGLKGQTIHKTEHEGRVYSSPRILYSRGIIFIYGRIRFGHSLPDHSSTIYSMYYGCNAIHRSQMLRLRLFANRKPVWCYCRKLHTYPQQRCTRNSAGNITLTWRRNQRRDAHLQRLGYEDKTMGVFVTMFHINVIWRIIRVNYRVSGAVFIF